MKILCIVCEVSEAMVWCCGDEAPLCNCCDTKIHSSNKLASRHRRVPLVESTPLPKCDICKVIFFLNNCRLYIEFYDAKYNILEYICQI